MKAPQVIEKRKISRNLPPSRIEFVSEEKHLTFRPLEVSDVGALKAAVSDSLPDLKRYMAWVHPLMPTDQQVEWILNIRSDYFLGKGYQFGVFDTDSGELLMVAGLHASTRLNPSCLELGYWTSSKHHGQGFATVCSQVLTAIAFHCFDANRVQAVCNESNKASIRVLEKCGYQFEGKMRNYSARPTKEMLLNGYVDEPLASLYAIVDEDLKEQDWYQNVLNKSKIFTLFNEETTFVDL